MKHRLYDTLRGGELKASGATAEKFLNLPGSNGAMFAYGTTVPTDTATGYATGCIFVHTDGGDNDAVYINEGSNSSCDFNKIAVDSPVDLTSLTATVAEINQACDESANVETVAATNVLAATESGKTCFLAHATEFDTKLPAPAAGLRFKFIVGLAPSSASYTVTTNGTTQNVIHGLITSAEDAAGAGAQTNGTPVDVITFVADKAQVGDWVEVICDGTYWYASGACVQQDAITLA
jgi:hypothetical protein